MGVGLSIKADATLGKRKLAAVVKKFTPEQLARPFRQIGLKASSEMRARLNERTRDWGNHTGMLARSINETYEPEGPSVVSKTNTVYARKQEEGGDIYPKDGGTYLAIPANDALRRSGKMPRDFARGELEFTRVALIDIHGHQWWGPAFLKAETESEFKRRKERQTKERARRKKRLRGSVIQVALRKKREAEKQIKRVMFALVKKVTLRKQPYKDHPKTIANVNAFARETFRKYFGIKNA